MKASAIIAKARLLLQDVAAVRWSEPDLLGWLNSAQLAVVAVRPDAKSVRADLPLKAGTEQELPANGLRLLSVLHNVGGRAITLVTRDELNAISLSWQTDRPRAAARHYLYDPDTPRLFDVWPPVEAGVAVRVSYTVAPAPCADGNSDIALDDLYEGPLIDAICARAYMQDSDDPADAGRAANHTALFMQALTGKAQTDQTTRPKRK